MSAVSPTPQQITATLRTHRDRTINMIIKQQHSNQHSEHNAPLPHHSVTAHGPRSTSTTLIHPHTERPSHDSSTDHVRRSAERGRLAEQRIRSERRQVSVERQARKQTAADILDNDRRQRQQQLQHQHNRNSRLPPHLTSAWKGSEVSVEEWRRKVREERETIEAEEVQMAERMKQMKERIVQLQAEERAEEERQQRSSQANERAEAEQRAADDKRRSDRQRWAANLKSESHYDREDRRASISTDSSIDSSSDIDAERGNPERDTAAELTRLWDEFKHRWTPEKQPAAYNHEHAATQSTAVVKEKDGELTSLTASTDASIRELTAMLNDMIKEFNITAAAAGDDKPIVTEPVRDERPETVQVQQSSKLHIDEVITAASVASVTTATAAANAIARKPSPLSSPASSPTRLNTAQRQRSTERGEAQEAEWQLILQELKHDKREQNQQSATDAGDGRGGGGRVGLFVPSIFNERDEKSTEPTQAEQLHQHVDEKKATKRAHVEVEDDIDSQDGEDGVVYSGLIDFDVNDPHEIDRQRRIEEQLAAEITERKEQHSVQHHKAQLNEASEAMKSSERVREAIHRYKQSGLTADDVKHEKVALGANEQTSELRSRQPMIDSTVDVRHWLERLERKIDALANQQQHPTLSQESQPTQRRAKRKTAVAQPAADIFAPIEPPQPDEQVQDEQKESARSHKQQAARASEPTLPSKDARPTSPPQHNNRPRVDNERKYADDERAHPSTTSRSHFASTHSSDAPPAFDPLHTVNQSSIARSLQRPNVNGGVVVDNGSGGLSLQECFSRRMGHIIASDEQRRQARRQRHNLAHSHCMDEYEQYTTSRVHPLSQKHPSSSRPSNSAVRQRRGPSAQSKAASTSYNASSTHLRMQQGLRGVIDVGEARARTDRMWRQLPEVRRRRDEQRKREERRRSVERRKSYDRQRRATQQRG